MTATSRRESRLAPVGAFLTLCLLCALAGAPDSSAAAATHLAAQGEPLSFEVFHLIFRVVEPGLYEVAQVVSVRNPGEEDYLGGPQVPGRGPAGLVVPLPPRASNVNALQTAEGGLDPSSLVLESRRLLSLQPVPPGILQVGVSYEMVAGPEGQNVEFSFPYPTQRFSLLVGGPAGAAVEVEAPGLARMQPLELGDQGTFAQWSAQSLAAGSTLTFRIGPTATPMSARGWAVIGLGIALGAAIVTSFVGTRQRRDLEALRGELIADIARIDLQHETGQISAAQHFERRSVALEQLLALDQVRGSAAEPGRDRGDGTGSQPRRRKE